MVRNIDSEVWQNKKGILNNNMYDYYRKNTKYKLRNGRGVKLYDK